MSLITLRRACGLLALAASAAVTPAVAAPRAAHTPPKASHTKVSRAKAKRTTKRVATRRRTAAAAKTAKAEAPALASLPALPTLVSQSLGTVNVGGAETPLEIIALAPSGAAPTDARPFAAFSASAERMLSGMIDRARSQLGTRYVLGGNRPDEALDCSSFARFAMQALGITLPRTAAQQAKIGDAVPRDRAQLRPGDLLTFGSRARVSHVGIYLGEGRFIHASVKSGQVIETTIERNTRLFRKWLGARRLLATNDSSPARGDG